MARLFLTNICFLISIIFSSINGLEIDFSKINVEHIRHALLAGASCVEIIDKFLERIEKYEKGPLQLNALVVINLNAREEALELDKHFQRTRSFSGTLHCVPMIVGDNIDVAHLPTTVGVRALAESVAPRDADVVQLLKNQGAVVVGKGNISPFTWEHRYVESQTAGLAKNAYCLSCTPYGASAGAAQATAAVYGLIGLGTDTGGSIALPASAASVLGLRPSWNLVSTRGVVPVNEYMDVVGPFTRYASDMALVLDVLDPSKRGRGFYDGVTRNSEDEQLTGLRIGVLSEAIYDKFMWPMTNSAHSSSFATFHLNDEVRRMITRAISDMKSIGAEISNVSLNVQRVMPHLATFGEFDISSCSSDWLNSYLSRLTSPAPYHSLNQLLRSRTLPDTFQRFYETAQRKAILQQCDTASETFHKARAGLRSLIMEPLFNGNKDLILFPMLPEFPTKIHDRRDQPLMGVQLAALAGYPSLTLPIGFGQVPESSAHTDSPQGLPTSILFIAKPDRMDALIKVSYVYQNRFGSVLLPDSVSGSDGNYRRISLQRSLGFVFVLIVFRWWN